MLGFYQPRNPQGARCRQDAGHGRPHAYWWPGLRDREAEHALAPTTWPLMAQTLGSIQDQA